jgi:type I restriction enzyme M protein
VDDKWLTSIKFDIQTEIDGISQRLTTRIKELGERYDNKLGSLAIETETLESIVAEHLQKMGLVWS